MGTLLKPMTGEYLFRRVQRIQRKEADFLRAFLRGNMKQARKIRDSWYHDACGLYGYRQVEAMPIARIAKLL